MLRLRLLLLCLLMWAVPLQGIAAVSMLFCDAGAGHSGQVEAVTPHHGEHDHHAMKVATDPSSDHHKALPDVGHKCGVCAACCSVGMISSVSHSPGVVDLPSALQLEPQVLIYAVSPRLPEKPPRA